MEGSLDPAEPALSFTPAKTDGPQVGCLTPFPSMSAISPEMYPTSFALQQLSATKPPLVPVREAELDDAENGPRRLEKSIEKSIHETKVALLEVPFKERNKEEGKRTIPPHIQVPPKRLFGYPERYKSPTDAMVSPISKGLLARIRRPARTMAPTVPAKALENTFQGMVRDEECAEQA